MGISRKKALSKAATACTKSCLISRRVVISIAIPLLRMPAILLYATASSSAAFRAISEPFAHFIASCVSCRLSSNGGSACNPGAWFCCCCCCCNPFELAGEPCEELEEWFEAELCIRRAVSVLWGVC